MIREDIKNPQELNQELTYLIEDMWAKMFALSLGVSCPNERVKELFIHFAMKRYKKDIPEDDEQYFYDLLPEFINHLANRY
jgi:hypothetical protein|tara:strand:+ start:205 stop:447 length:243 start_codon:yes stop_codon:yes gene_type:complete